MIVHMGLRESMQVAHQAASEVRCMMLCWVAPLIDSVRLRAIEQADNAKWMCVCWRCMCGHVVNDGDVNPHGGSMTMSKW